MSLQNMIFFPCPALLMKLRIISLVRDLQRDHQPFQSEHSGALSSLTSERILNHCGVGSLSIVL